MTAGLWDFATSSEEAIAQGLQAALGVIQQNQKRDLRIMLRYEEKLGGVGIKGLNITGADYMSNQIEERKRLTGVAPEGGSSAFYYWDPDAGGLKIRK